MTTESSEPIKKGKDTVLYVVFCLLFGPFILAKPCGVAGNCMSFRKMIGPFAGLQLVEVLL